MKDPWLITLVFLYKSGVLRRELICTFFNTIIVISGLKTGVSLMRYAD